MDCGTSAGNHAARSVRRGDGSTSSAAIEGNANGASGEGDGVGNGVGDGAADYGEGEGVGNGAASGEDDGVGNGTGIGKIVESKVAHVEIDVAGPSWCV